MNSREITPVPTGPCGRQIGWLLALAAAFAATPAQAQPALLVGNWLGNGAAVGQYDPVTGAAIHAPFISLPNAQNMVLDQHNHLFIAGIGVGEYDATTGATINANFITGLNYGPWRLALDANNHLFVSGVANVDSNIVGVYDATTGATINAGLIKEPNPQGLTNPRGLAVDNNNHLFVSNNNANTVAEYDATTGAIINATFIHQGLQDPDVLLLDGHGHLLVGDNRDTATVGMYDATTGATINAALVPGLTGGAVALALDGNNHLFVANNNVGVGEYDATTGAIINEHLITVTQPHFTTGLAFATEVPEPSSLLLLSIAGLSVLRNRRPK